jgi:hypothetical protein
MRTKISILLIFLFSFSLLLSCRNSEKYPETERSSQSDAGSSATPSQTKEADQDVEPLRAFLGEVIGHVLARADVEESFAEVGNGFVLEVLGQVETKSGAKVRLDLSDNTLIRLGENSLFTLENPEEEAEGLLTRIRLEIGEVWIILNGGALEVETPSGVAAVRGSYMYVEYDPATGEMRITCLEGDCLLSNEHGTVHISAGETAIITGAGQPPQTGKMSLEDIQNWLDNNPEAILVVPYLTEIALTLTPPATATFTPIPTNTGVGEIFPPPPPPPIKPAPVVQIDNIAPASSVVGEVVNYSVSVLPTAGGPTPTGSVEVKAAFGLICTVTLSATGSGSCNGTLPTATTHNIQAFYTGDESYGTNYSISQSYVVTAASTTTTLDNYIPSPSVVGESVTVSFTVAPNAPGSGIPTGSVTVGDGTDTCTVDASVGQCNVVFTTTGLKTMNVTFAGNTNYSASTSGSVIHTVNQTSTTTDIQSFAPNPSTTGVAVTFNATVDVDAPGSGTPFGSVTFTDTLFTSDTCTVFVAPWSCSINFSNPGARSVTASYSGDANFVTSTSTTVVQFVATSNDAYFYNAIGPNGFTVTGPGDCSQNYSVNVIDVDGVTAVEMEYILNDLTFAGTTTKVSLSLSGANTWSETISIPLTSSDIAYWRFMATDSFNNNTFHGGGITTTSGYPAGAGEYFSFDSTYGLACPTLP